jgi:hypothetical protein
VFEGAVLLRGFAEHQQILPRNPGRVRAIPVGLVAFSNLGFENLDFICTMRFETVCFKTFCDL